MKDALVHVAAEPVGGVQDCARCKRILVDNRSTHAIGNTRPRFYQTGDHVLALENGSCVVSETPTCVVR